MMYYDIGRFAVSALVIGLRPSNRLSYTYMFQHSNNTIEFVISSIIH